MSTPKPTPTPQQQRHQNIVDALYFIHMHGWLRPIELGGFLWPKNALPRAPGYAIAKVLQQLRLVHAIVLPDRVGRALVLARRGAALLRENGIATAQAQECWQCARSWRHELIAAGVLAALYKDGWDILPEREIRRRTGSHQTTKIPDGLACDRGGNWWWIEVEHARKSGPQLRRLATHISATSGKVEICGMRTTGVLLAYPKDVRDEGGHRIDHRRRVTHAAETWIKGPVPILWAPCQMLGAGVLSVTTESEVLYPSAARRVLKVLDARKWEAGGDGDSWIGTHPPHTAYVWHDEEYGSGWWSDVEGPNLGDECAAYSATLSGAKMAAAQRIADALAKGKTNAEFLTMSQR